VSLDVGVSGHACLSVLHVGSTPLWWRERAGNPFCAATIVTPHGANVFLPPREGSACATDPNKKRLPGVRGRKKTVTRLALAEVSLVPARFLDLLGLACVWGAQRRHRINHESVTGHTWGAAPPPAVCACARCPCPVIGIPFLRGDGVRGLYGLWA